ncbi:hypothetical protein [Natronospira bacteriovora]|uniref:Uncharacterized protein n=1 Tax=Natronospira bacteriovora TaxID=3069753 RepID=A0ABU0W5J9_9GAMM|nr:hypothetical protein [Natronospira sp. AB-CW4]MDQ2069296.1 hypothetical protein [Natronospira sp. AB-CW4]
MKANMRNAMIITVLAMMAMSVVACFSSSSADGGSDWDEARIVALEDQVADLEDRVTSLEQGIHPGPLTRVRVGGAGSGGAAAGLVSAAGAAGEPVDVGQAVHHLPQQEFRRSSSYEVVSNEGYLFELPARAEAVEISIGRVGQIEYDAPDCQGSPYIREIGTAGAAQGYVFRQRTDADPFGEDPENYWMVPAGSGWSNFQAYSYWDNNSNDCTNRAEPWSVQGVPIQLNDPDVTGVPSGRMMGPTIMGLGD